MTYDEIETRVEAFMARRQADKPVIVAYGLMNAGKSFLMNMLTEHVQQEYFKTNDIRETVENARCVTSQCIYLDTPGLDANDEDDSHAQNGASEGDIVMFVHQPQGELEKVEVEFLRKLGASLGEYASSNIVVVLSKIEKEAPEKITQIEARIGQQCAEVLGFTPPIFRVSGKLYQDGVLKQKDALVAASGIAPLIAHLHQVVADVRAVRAEKARRAVDGLLQDVELAQRALRRSRDDLRARVVSRFGVFNDQIQQLRRFLDDSAASFKKIQG